ncbi:hypothetical protein JW979_00040, partial [bacterium]|nr:hypothetical protein [candidate division CSSED10-310 bacterium]
YEVEIDELTKLKCKPEYRIGYAFIPSDRFVFAIDYTLSKTRDPFGRSLNEKTIAAGFESHLGTKKLLTFRAGSSFSLEGKLPLLFSTGISFNISKIVLDCAYMTDMDGESRGMWAGLRTSF